jgi:hypothetical protein
MERGDIHSGLIVMVELDPNILVEVLATNISGDSIYCYNHTTDSYLTACAIDFTDRRVRVPTKAELLLYKKNKSMDEHISKFRNDISYGVKSSGSFRTDYVADFINYIKHRG